MMLQKTEELGAFLEKVAVPLGLTITDAIDAQGYEVWVVSNDKAIQHGKLKRRAYRGSKAIDRTCRNHGSCKYCEANRKYSDKQREEEANDKQRTND